MNYIRVLISIRQWEMGSGQREVSSGKEVVFHHWTFCVLGLTSTSDIGYTVSGIKGERHMFVPKCAHAR